ncbi:hypothetical protein ACFQU2_07995 [Siccirubricoccus deserti]
MAATLGVAQATRQAAERGGEQAVEQGSEAVREGTGQVAEVLRRGADVSRHGSESMAETARHGVRIAAEGQQSVMRQAAAEMEQAGRGLADIAQEAAEGLRHFMAVPGGRGMQDTHQALQTLVDGVIATNLRMARELMRRTGPSAFIELQRISCVSISTPWPKAARCCCARRARQPTRRCCRWSARWRGAASPARGGAIKPAASPM